MHLQARVQQSASHLSAFNTLKFGSCPNLFGRNPLRIKYESISKCSDVHSSTCVLNVCTYDVQCADGYYNMLLILSHTSYLWLSLFCALLLLVLFKPTKLNREKQYFSIFGSFFLSHNSHLFIEKREYYVTPANVFGIAYENEFFIIAVGLVIEWILNQQWHEYKWK